MPSPVERGATLRLARLPITLLQGVIVRSPRWQRAAAYVVALAAPLALTVLMFRVPEWPRPYSWQYLGVSLAVAITCGIGPGLVALSAATGAVLSLGVPTPVHPGVEMFVTIDLCLLALLHRWRRTQQELSERGAVLEAVFESMPDAVYIATSEGITLCNRSAVRMIGGTPPAEGSLSLAALAERLAVRWPATGRRLTDDELPLSRALRGETVVEEILATNAGTGQDVYIRTACAPVVGEGGSVVAAVAVNWDITAQKKAEEELHEANRRKNDFIALLSHELRNPLAPIRYAIPLLEEEPLGEAGNRALGVVDRQVRHLSRLVDDLLDVSRITRGQIELRRERVAVAEVTRAAVEAASPAMLAARHHLDVVVPEQPIWIDADAARVAQVITNLLDNAAKYTPRGGRIALEAAAEDGSAVVRVRDTGVGIPKDAMPAVFEMFRSLGGGDQPQTGLGIGLALSKQLVEMQGGTIEARSGGIGQGAEFVVRLPLAATAEPQPIEAQAPRPRQVARLKVLVVDDNVDLVEMLATVIERLGHEVRKAIDGQSAITAAMSYRPDVMLLDLGLPLVGGLEVARELRRHPEMAHMRLVALTGWGQDEDRRHTAEAGFNRHLTKPTDPRKLEELLAEFAHEMAR